MTPLPSSEHHIESIPLRRVPVDVGVLLALATDVMQRQARTLGVTLEVHIDDEVPDTVRLDRDKVAWAITNLIGSALRHVRSPGGAVAVDVSYDRSRASLSITVHDDGPGIPSDQLTRLLNRERWRPGAALALLLVEDIAVAHGGGIEIDSKAERSEHFTRIRFTIAAD